MKKTVSEDKIVSFADEKLIAVDEQDNIIDYKTRTECHQGAGTLHRAFSIFIFNDHQELLLQKRSTQKLLWPDFWSNSCCSHPRQSQKTDFAARRRLKEELGIETDLIYLYTFQYHARFGSIGSERELCAVYIGKSNEPVRHNKNEISVCKYVKIESLTADLVNNPGVYTPWLQLEWLRLMGEYREQLNTIFL
jgi:isopentenyl-diphosphate delta-isomerase